MKNYLAAIGILISLSTGVAFAQEKPQDHYKNLATARTFAIGPVGLIRPTALGQSGLKNSISPVEKDLWELIQAKDEKSLLALTKENNTVAQMYGLLGLHYLGSEQQKPVADLFSKSQNKVAVTAGCVISNKDVPKIAEQITQGWYDKALKRDTEPPK